MSDKKPGSDNAGAIRAAGGGFAKMEIAHEEEYFYKQVRNHPGNLIYESRNQLHEYF